MGSKTFTFDDLKSFHVNFLYTVLIVVFPLTIFILSIPCRLGWLVFMGFMKTKSKELYLWSSLQALAKKVGNFRTKNGIISIFCRFVHP